MYEKFSRLCTFIQVNHEDLREASHDRAIQVLRQTPALVHMVIFRDESLLKEDEMYDVFTVDMLKKPNKGLGLSIVGRRKDTGVFISDIVSSPTYWAHAATGIADLLSAFILCSQGTQST